jgi:hypothetical protein
MTKKADKMGEGKNYRKEGNGKEGRKETKPLESPRSIK